MPGDIVTVLAYLQAQDSTPNSYTGQIEARTQWTIPAFQANTYPVNLYADPELTARLTAGDKRPHRITLECEYLLRAQNGPERDHRRYYNYRWKLLAIDHPDHEVTQTLPPTPLRQKANPNAGVAQGPYTADTPPRRSQRHKSENPPIPTLSPEAARSQAIRLAAASGLYDLSRPDDQQRFTAAADWLTQYLLNPHNPEEPEPP